MGLIQRIWGYIEQQGLATPGERLIVGVSGGPDSLCLLDALHRLAPSHGLTLHVAHYNHGLRAEAGEEADFVRAHAEDRGLSYSCEEEDTRAYAEAQGLGLEAAARRLRYAFLARVARAAGATCVAVGHTADDQAETVLMHLLRGSGLAGLRGMTPRVEMNLWMATTLTASTELPIVRLIRPLLAVTRAEVERYCAERGLIPRLDKTNLDTQYFRNWVRFEALPFLEQRNPNLRATLARTAEVLAGEYDVAQAAVKEAWERVTPQSWQAPGQVVFDRQVWMTLSLPLWRGLLRRAIEQLRGGMHDIDFAPLDAAARFAQRAEAGRSCEAPGGMRLLVQRDRIVLADALKLAAATLGPLVNETGQLSAGWRLTVERLEAGEWDWEAVVGATRWTAFVDADSLSGPLEIRGRRPGERFQPLGLGGHRAKISDFMVNAKVPVEARQGWPVVACGGEAIWLAGLRVDERYRVRPETGAVLRLTFAQDEAAGAC